MRGGTIAGSRRRRPSRPVRLRRTSDAARRPARGDLLLDGHLLRLGAAGALAVRRLLGTLAVAVAAPDLPLPERPAGFDAGFDPDRRRAGCPWRAVGSSGAASSRWDSGGLLLGRRVDAVVHLPGSGRCPLPRGLGRARRGAGACAGPRTTPWRLRRGRGRVGRLGRAGSIVESSVGVGDVARAPVTGRSVTRRSSSVCRRPTWSRSAGLVPPPRPRPPRRRRRAPLDVVPPPLPSAGSSADRGTRLGRVVGSIGLRLRGGTRPRGGLGAGARCLGVGRASVRPRLRARLLRRRARGLRQGRSPLERGDALVDLGNGRRLRRRDLGLVIHCYSSRSGREGAPVPARDVTTDPRACAPCAAYRCVRCPRCDRCRAPGLARDRAPVTSLSGACGPRSWPVSAGRRSRASSIHGNPPRPMMSTSTGRSDAQHNSAGRTGGPYRLTCGFSDAIVPSSGLVPTDQNAGSVSPDGNRAFAG